MTEELKIHPVAALFPMMSDAELNDLAADIAANGLQYPVVLDREGVILDGRNRLEACRRAGVAPTWTTLNGVDPVAYILGANVLRRHLSKPQLAVLVLRTLDRQTSDDYHWGTEEMARDYGVPRQYLSMAATVLEYLPELGDAVLVNRVSLQKAYEAARERKAAIEGEEAANERAREALADLREVAPDLAALVDENRMPLGEAQGAYTERLRERDARIRTRTGNLLRGVDLFTPPAAVDDWPTYMRDWWLYVDPGQLNLDVLTRARDFLEHIVGGLQDGRNGKPTN